MLSSTIGAKVFLRDATLLGSLRGIHTSLVLLHVLKTTQRGIDAFLAFPERGDCVCKSSRSRLVAHKHLNGRHEFLGHVFEQATTHR